MINIIVAVDKYGGFSNNKTIPWHYPEDFKRFRQMTTGKVCVMGHNTYKEILDMATKRQVDVSASVLPNRECYVVSKSTTSFIGAKHAPDLNYVMDRHNTDIFIIGGEKLFIQALAWADNVMMTVIDRDYKCDTFFPVQALDAMFTIKSGETVTSNGDTLYFVNYSKKR